jgi:hypothetical protein
MATRRLFKLPLDPDSIDDVRAHFDSLEDRHALVERGLALEGMNAKTAWLDEREPALYYLHEESKTYPADVDESDIDEELQELSNEHHGFFQQVVAPGHEHPDDLVEFERLFSASV